MDLLSMETQGCILPLDQQMVSMPMLTGRSKQFFPYLTQKTAYFQIPLMNKEFSYDVDVSNVGCHCNAAAYFIDMPGLSSTQYHHILRDIF